MRWVVGMLRGIAWAALGGCTAAACANDDAPAPVMARSKSATAAAPEPAPAVPEPPLVDLSGQARPASVVVTGGEKRIHSRASRTWVRETPSASGRRIGYLRAGASSPTTAEPASHDGCSGGWYPVHPQGFVCAGVGATLDGNDPIVRATAEHPPDHMRRLPYIYGTVRKPGPVYLRLPTADEVRAAEPGFEKRMKEWLSIGGEIGASYAQDVWLGYDGTPPNPTELWNQKVSRGVPAYLRDSGMVPNISRRPRNKGQLKAGRMVHRVGHSFLQTFVWEGRRYGITTDLRILPTDRLRPIRGSSFHGVEIGKDVNYPFALVRSPRARYWTRLGRSVAKGPRAPYRAAIQLTGKQLFFDGVLHYETADGKWLSDREASRLDPAKKFPGWAVRGEKWIDVNLAKQTLVLFEGKKAVFATLVSTGEAGLGDPEKTTATKRGIFRIHTKHITATMAGREVGEEFELRDVPYVQYFDTEGYALHGAYWHDRFGTPKSHGCINLSPEDARRVFHWTEPQVPRGWHGALLPLKGTVVFIHR